MTHPNAPPIATINLMKSTQSTSGKKIKNRKEYAPFEEKQPGQNPQNQKALTTMKYIKGKEEVVKFPCKICMEDHLTYKCTYL